jgi:hypothetical protein
MSDDPRELPEQLRALGRGLSAHVPEDLADRVLVGIAHAPVKRRALWQRWVAAIAALIVAVAVSVAISAPVRAAITSVFGFGGVEVREGTGPSPASSPVLPGEHRIDVAAAQREVGFRIRIPSALGPPDWVTVADGRVVSLHYERSAGPVQIDQFEGNLGVMWEKFAMGLALRTTVDGHDALWFEDPVTLVYVDASGRERTESARVTNGSLVWIEDGQTFRLDGIRPLNAALAVAHSMS